MVAYSFQKQFIEPILKGTKRQTIRALRRGRSRHARPGEQVQLYVGLRTKYTQFLGAATCSEIQPITINIANPAIYLVVSETVGQMLMDGELDTFAHSDGFASWEEMRAFWRKHHPGVDEFRGVLIRWGEIRT